MKSILLAAAALIAMPAIAQDQPMPAAEPPESTAPMPASDPATSGPAAAPAPAAGSTASDPVGGYQPSGPAMQGTAAPGATVRFQPAPDPNTAFPPPPAMEKYPVCKKGQYDKCIQRGGK